MPDGKSE